MKVDEKMELNRLEKKVLKTIKDNKLIQTGDKIVLAVSGGPDSICMLNVFSKMCQTNPSHSAQIVVAHVNHLIREEAQEDEKYVQKICEEKGIEFYSKSIDVLNLANTSKIGVEEAGRIARYEFFDEILKKTNSNKIAIAHNKNDKAETIIMNIFRGSGLGGLRGIETKRGKYIRPLIDCNREEIEEYCKDNELNPRIDKTNFDNTYTRNKIRNIVIPYIKKEFNPNFIETINRLSLLASEQGEYIDRIVEQSYKEMLIEEFYEKNKLLDIQEKINKANLEKILCQTNTSPMAQIVLDLRKFNKEERVIKSGIILYTITKLFGTSKGIEKIHIEDLIRLCENNIGNKYLTPNKNLKVLVKNHKIYFIKQS